MLPVGKRDPCWIYFKEERRKNRAIAVCTFCGRGCTRISIAKRHIVGGSCKKATSDVKLAIQNCIYFKEKVPKKIQSRVHKKSSKTAKMKKIMQNVKQVVANAAADDVANDGLVNVNDYKVKPDIAPVLKSIFAKYGDITSSCSYKTINMRTHLLEVICKLVQRLKKVISKLVQRLQYSDLKAIISDLDSIQNELSDVQTSKIDVSWLNKRLAAVLEVAAVKDKLLQLKKSKAIFGFVIDPAKKEKKLRLIQLLKRDIVFGALERFKDARELYLAAEKRADALEVFDKKLHDDIMECIKEYTSRKKFQDLP